MKLLGLLIGKAILMKIPLKCNLNRIILRYISQNSLELCDVYSYDSKLYEKWLKILKH